MTVYTMRLSSVRARYTVRSQDVETLFHKLYMPWVTTTLIFTNYMIKNLHTVVFRKFSDKFFVHKSVGLFGNPSVVKVPITHMPSPMPYPTIRKFIDLYLREHSLQFGFI